ncbi:MAG: GNAT family N-acetyltransferase [Clostridia bacterium]|nr:GNAT family N-acetyltransferase [Clostridia bacterium]
MLFTEKTIKLKDGRNAVLRGYRREDAPEVLELMKKISGETEFIVRYPEEWESCTVGQEEAWIEDAVSSPNKLALCCTVDGRIVGNCEIRFYTSKKLAHRSVAGVSVLREYWGLGIGSAFFAELIAAANEKGSGLIELEFVEGNDRARRLYEKFGFRVVSERPYAFRLKDGGYRKEFYMQKLLK